ncbi:lyase family protein [Ottowia thiooxydans]|uniref:lyase family protein n=1 Tax=Ottowia thiooxydans TaxID=219182 RepID=UPI000401D36A|nr:lyase family protein [Ottowia thiooxydans]
MNAFGQSLLPGAAHQLFDDAALCRAFLDFESALAEAQASEGLIPVEAAEAIAAACAATQLDAHTLAGEARHGGAMAVPLVAMIAATLEQREEAHAVRYLHFGATTQDVVDTAQVLMTKQALAQLLAPLEQCITLLRDQAARHARTPMLARTLLQPAQIMSWGLKCASWLQPLQRSHAHLLALAEQALVLQLGGATGNQSALGEAGERIAARMAKQLGLGHAPSSWHTQRDAWLRFGLEVAVLMGSLSKIAKDLALLSQAEVGEVSEGAGASTAPNGSARGGSSAMPHKRNPVACMQAIAACAQGPGIAATLLSTMAQAHERGLGEWQAEVAVWPQLWIQAFGATSAVRDALSGLQVDTARMTRNIDNLQGLVHSEALTQALAAAVGKKPARARIQALGPLALSSETPLLQLLLTDTCVQALPEGPRTALQATLAAACDLDLVTEPSARLCKRLLEENHL